jgi:hypothetical protein
MSFPYHRNEMHVNLGEGNKKKIKSAVACDRNSNMENMVSKYHMLQPDLLEQKEAPKWYMKLFKRLLSMSIHNSVVHYNTEGPELLKSS